MCMCDSVTVVGNIWRWTLYKILALWVRTLDIKYFVLRKKSECTTSNVAVKCFSSLKGVICYSCSETTASTANLLTLFIHEWIASTVSEVLSLPLRFCTRQLLEFSFLRFSDGVSINFFWDYLHFRSAWGVKVEVWISPVFHVIIDINLLLSLFTNLCIKDSKLFRETIFCVQFQKTPYIYPVQKRI